jgi:CRISPR-associated endonuclease/helicase Cas3
MPLPRRWFGSVRAMLTHHTLDPDRRIEPAAITLLPELLDQELRALLDGLPVPSDNPVEPVLWEAAAVYGRLALVMADQLVSRAPLDLTLYPAGDVTPGILVANTADGRPKQGLTEHLAKVSVETAQSLAYLNAILQLAPALDVRELPQPFKEPARGRFAWQDAVRDSIANRPQGGFFGLLMAATGSGKTQAAAKAMTALSPMVRYTVALPLRTLTTQTGAEYRSRLGLGDNDLAVVIGNTLQRPAIDASGSVVWRDDDEPEVDGGARWPLPEALARHIGDGQRARQILAPPVLVTTIDHLMSAADQRRTSYVVAALRLLTADLVIDEIDVFSEADLVAIGRLVHLAGVLGRNVFVASATLPPAIARSLWRAYRAGYSCHAALFGKPDRAAFGLFSNVTAPVVAEGDIEALDGRLEDMCTAIVRHVRAEPSPRRAEILSRDSAEDLPTLFAAIRQSLATHHHRHACMVDFVGRPQTLSLQLVYCAHVDACVAVARSLEANPLPDIDVRHVVYHARHPAIARARIERFLDRILKRDDADRALLADPIVRRTLQDARTDALAIVVIATSVEEVGRDHDFDAAVLEPTSSRSMIQLPGRVQRHRLRIPVEPNVTLLPTSIRRVRGAGGPFAFHRPGAEGPDFEDASRRGCIHPPFRLPSPWLDELIDPAAWHNICAAPRLDEHSDEPLVALEHQRLAAFLEGRSYFALPSMWNGTAAALAATHPEVTRFRDGDPREIVWLDAEVRVLRQFDVRANIGGVNARPIRFLNGVEGGALLDLRAERLLPAECPTEERKRHMRLELPLHDGEWFYAPAFGVFREFEEHDARD